MSDLASFVFAEKSSADVKFYDYDVTIAGKRGSGKTTLAIELYKDDCCVVDVENGAKSFDDIYKITPQTWSELKKIQREWKKGIKSGAKPPFSVLLFDTQTKLQLMCQEYVLDENGWDDFTQGADGVNRWNVLKNEYTSVMNEFKAMGFKIVRICHGKDKQFKPRGQEPYNQYAADVGASFDYDVLGAVDFVFYLEKARVTDESGDKKEVRRLVLQNDMDYDVKCRFPELPDEILYEDVEEGAKAFYDAWDEAVAIRSGKKSKKSKEEKTKFEFAPKEEVITGEVGKEVIDDMYSLQEKAIEVRDSMTETMTKQEVSKAMKEILGTVKIKECEDEEALKEFIDKYSE